MVERQRQATSQNDDSESSYFHILKNWFRNDDVSHAFVVFNEKYSVCDVFEIYDNNISPRLIMIIVVLIIHVSCANKEYVHTLSYISNTSHTLMISPSTRVGAYPASLL